MKLLVATQNFAPTVGGIERYAQALVSAMATRGVAVTVLAPEHPDAAALDAFSAPYRVVRYGGSRVRELGLGASVLLRAGETFDATLCMQWSSLPVSVGLRRLARVRSPLAVICHGKEVMPVSGAGARAIEWVRRACLREASHVIAVSAYTAARAIEAGAPSERVSVLNPGVDCERFVPPTPSERARFRDPNAGPHLVTVARLVPRKGIDRVIAALPALVQAHPRLRYLIAGEGPDRARLEALVAELGVGEHVRWLGTVGEASLPALYAAGDLFVLASRSIPGEGDVEGFGLVLLEAQACGTPVVATRSGGMPDALRHGVTGELMSDDQPETIAKVLGQLLADTDRRERMSVAAREHALSQAWSEVAARLESLLSGNAT